MAGWKVLVTVSLGLLSLALAWGAIITLISGEMEHKWLWFSGFLFGTIGAGSLLAFFLKSAEGGGQDKWRR
jgi:hypothetical protein